MASPADRSPRASSSALTATIVPAPDHLVNVDAWADTVARALVEFDRTQQNQQAA